MASEKRVTMRDIAEALGVHLTTVAAALKNRPNISDATKHRVREKAKDLGYRPDPMLSALSKYSKGNQSLKQGTIIAFLGYALTREAMMEQATVGRQFRAAQERVQLYGYKLQYFCVPESEKEQKRLNDVLYNRGVYGLIIASTTPHSITLHLDWERFSAVCIGFSLGTPAINRVIPNHYANIKLMLNTLKKKGYQRIGLFYLTPVIQRSDHLVLASYHVQTQAAGLPVIEPLIEKEPTPETAMTWAREQRVDAIITIPHLARLWKEVSRKAPWAKDIRCCLAFFEGADAPYAGIDENQEEIVRAAVDTLSNQIMKNDLGIPKQKRTIAISGLWRDASHV